MHLEDLTREDCLYMPEVLPEPSRHLVVVYKANCADDAKRTALEAQVQNIMDLPDRWASAQAIATTPGETYLDELDAAMGDNTDVVIFGGDGTTSRALERLHASKHTGIRAVLAGAGTENDMAHTHGEAHYNDPLYILDHGRETEVYPLEATFGKGSEQEQKLTAFYTLGLGASAVTAESADAQPFRDLQRARAERPLGTLRTTIAKYKIALDSLVHRVPFRTRAYGEEPRRGKHRLSRMTQTVDLQFAGSSRVAGGAITMPTESNNPLEFAVHQTRNRLHSMIGSMAILSAGLAQKHSGVYRTYLADAPKVEKDGDQAGDMPAGALEVRRSKKAITVLNVASAHRTYRGKHRRS